MATDIGELTISSPDFDEHSHIPFELTADGGNSTPRLEFAGAPEGTVEYAIACHDPDAPLPDGFAHWVIFGVPATSMTLDLRDPKIRVGPNSRQATSWFGPRPPRGHGDHHYYFWIYALRREVVGEPDLRTFLTSYADDIIEQARTVGLSRRD